MQVKIVIGANYGDEGKGMVTEWLCRNSYHPIVVLGNGAPQRGHTVERKDNLRHVFHHFGSGTLFGTSTYIPKHFSVNPQIFVQEWNELRSKNVTPQVYIDPDCLVMTAFDTALCQGFESARRLRHGSVGLGYWESVLRANRYPIHFKQFSDMSREERKEKLIEIRDKWVPFRIETFELEEGFKFNESLLKIVSSDGYIEHWLDDFETMVYNANIVSPATIDFVFSEGTLIFENGQGLLLSKEDNNNHTTPSDCGVKCAVEWLKENSCWREEKIDIDVYFVSRTYITRHGSGPFPEEDECVEHFNDETNVPNDWQGSLRYGSLNVSELLQRCENEMTRAKSMLNTNWSASIVFTHANEIPLPLVEQQEDMKIFFSDSKYSQDIHS